jgi:hypothetical protein
MFVQSKQLNVIVIHILPVKQYRYRVIHKSVKHLKNSQQINYATGHDNSYSNRERKSSKYFLKKARAQSCRGLPLGSNSITAAVALVDRDMMTRVWDEMDYRIDVCRKTKDRHIKHL